MKKLFYSFFAAAAMLFAASSCSQEEMIENGTSGDEVEVSFNVEMEGQTASRAIADGLTVDQLIFAVFDENNQEIEALRQEDVVVSNKGAVVKTRLVKGQSYQFVFWAQKKDAGHYNTTSMKNIKLNTTVLNNDETRDAFYAHEPLYKVTGSFVKPITLKRPFAQLNLATTKEDLEWAEKAGVVIDKSSVKVTGPVYTTLNTLSGYCADKVEGEFELALNAIPDAATEKLTITDSENQFENDDYYYLSTSYLLVSPKEALTEEIVFTLTAGDTDEVINTLTVTNAPLQRNWRTNIIGEILTGEGTFNIVIDPIFDADRNYPMDGSELDIWDGTVTENLTPNAAGEYEINSAADLLALSNVDVTGKTIVLKKDLSFKNVETRAGDTTPATIEPLFAKEGTNGASRITFLGNDHVIRDFIIAGDNARNSLFGQLTSSTVKNLTIINADVTGVNEDHNWAAILAAKVVNSTFENVTIKDSKLVGVQKTGALIGYVENDEGKETKVINCTVEGLELSNHDHAEAGSTGGLIGCINVGKATIENSYVKNSTFALIQNSDEAKRANSEFIGVIRGGVEVSLLNCGVEGNTYSCTPDTWIAYYEHFVGGNDKSTLTVNGKTIIQTTGTTDLTNLRGFGVVDFSKGFDNTGDEDKDFIKVNEGDWTFENGSVTTGSTADYGFIVAGENSTATYNDVAIDSKGGGIGVVDGAEVTFNSGSLAVNSASTSGRYLFYVVGEGSKATINGGEFSFSKTLNQKRSYIYVDAGATVYVNGGTFGPASTRDGYTAGILGNGTVIITGGTFGFDPSKWVAEGYEAVKSGSTWTVSQK